MTRTIAANTITRRTAARPPKDPAAAGERATYTVNETAAILGISRTTAYECIHRGEIPARRFGRRVVVLRHELEAILHTTS
jgi:excisionase family DNA binding protein